MPQNLQIVRPSDFVCLDAQGKPDLAASERALSAVAKACVDRGIDCALLDVRNVQSNLGLVDLYQLVKAFDAMGFQPNHRLAVLHRYSGGEGAEFFAICASMRGWNVRAFDNFEEAIEWFSVSQPG